MNTKTIVPLAIALVLGVLAAKVGKDMLARRGQGGTNAKMTKFVVAKDDVAPGSALRETDLALRDLPTEGMSEHAFTSTADLIGRVVTTQIVKNQAVLETLLASRGAAGGAQAMIPPGMRAITLEVNEFSGVAGLLTPGSHVDVVQTIHTKSDNAGLMAKTIVENLKVLAVGRRMSTVSSAADDVPELAKSVTLLATAAEAEAIDLAAHVGQPRLVLRNALDESVHGGKGVTVAELRGQQDERPANDDGKWNAMVAQLLLGGGGTTRPVEQPKVTREPKTFREIEVIRAGASSSVRVTLNANGTFTGSAEKLQTAVPEDR